MKKMYVKTPSISFTREGYEKVKKEYDELLHTRPQAVSELKQAREMGDLSENGFYKGARAKLSHIDSQLAHLKHLLRFGVIQESAPGETIQLGSTITLAHGKDSYVYKLVGKFEANPTEGKISDHSPLGTALIGKKVGDSAIVATPSGTTTYTITTIAYA